MVFFFTRGDLYWVAVVEKEVVCAHIVVARGRVLAVVEEIRRRERHSAQIERDILLIWRLNWRCGWSYGTRKLDDELEELLERGLLRKPREIIDYISGETSVQPRQICCRETTTADDVGFSNEHERHSLHKKTS